MRHSGEKNFCTLLNRLQFYISKTLWRSIKFRLSKHKYTLLRTNLHNNKTVLFKTPLHIKCSKKSFKSWMWMFAIYEQPLNAPCRAQATVYHHSPTDWQSLSFREGKMYLFVVLVGTDGKRGPGRRDGDSRPQLFVPRLWSRFQRCYTPNILLVLC